LGARHCWFSRCCSAGRTLRQAQARHGIQAIDVVATVVKHGSAPTELEAVGTVQAVRQVTLAPETTGRVVAIQFEDGQRVAADAPLIQLFDAPEQADLAAAKARAEFAKLQVQRTHKLVPTAAASRELLQQRQSDCVAALASIQQIEAKIAQKQIRAPFAGDLGFALSIPANIPIRATQS
jgi:multidrug efflux system membrane fusion protein